MLVLEIALALSAALWLGLAAFWFWNARGVTMVRPGDSSPLPAAPPRVSIIVPARNEEEILAAHLASVFRIDYPAFEVIVVNDDSTDRTGRIAHEFAASPEFHGRLRVIDNRELPPGWTGKVHALSLAAREAKGDWILATDADVLFHPAALRAAVSLALREDAQLLSLLGRIECAGFWEKVMMPAFAVLISSLYPVRLVNSRSSARALAAGAFILMRRRDFEALGGYDPIRNTVIEDARIAQHFKRNDRRICLAVGADLLRTRMYSGVGEMWEGLSRSAFEGAGLSVAKVFAEAAVGNFLCVFPWIAFFALAIRAALPGHLFGSGMALGLALTTCIVSTLIYLPVVLMMCVPAAYALALPLATIFYSGVALNSMWRSLFGAGVRWKERHYRPPA